MQEEYTPIEKLPRAKTPGIWEERFSKIPEGTALTLTDSEEGQRARVALNALHKKGKCADYKGKSIKGVTYIIHNKPETGEKE